MTVRRLTRDQIAKIVNNDPEAIRAFEDLFRQATDTGPSELILVRSDVDSLLQSPVETVAREALDWAVRIQDFIDNLGYAQIIKNFDQSAGAIDTATAVTWDSLNLGRNITIGSPASRIVFARKGIYKVNLTVQVASGSSAQKNIWVWFRQNGVDIASSSVIETETTNGGYAPISRSEVFSLEADDYLEVMFAVDDTDLFLDATAATAFAPGAPSAIVNIEQLHA